MLDGDREGPRRSTAENWGRRDGIRAGSDTLSFSGLADDTSFTTIRNTETKEVKFFFQDIFVDCMNFPALGASVR